MGEVKLNIEANSLQEIFEDLVECVESIGAIVIKPSLEEIPEMLESYLKTKGILLFRPGSGDYSELIKALLEEDQESVLEAIIENSDSRERVIELLQEEGYEIQKAESQDQW